MTELDAMRWLEKQPGLWLQVGKDRKITLTDGVSVQVEGTGILGAVIQLQKILKEMQK